MREISQEYLDKHKGCILCYSGSKARYLQDLYSVLPEEKGLKVLDLMAGGGSLCTNLPEDYTVTANDSESRVIDIHKVLYNISEDCNVDEAEGYVKKFCRSWVKDNKDEDGYNKLKRYYNKGVASMREEPSDFVVNPLELFALTMSSNTNYMRFNSKTGAQNIKFGKRYYNPSSSKKMINYLERISTRDITWKDKDFREYDFTKYDLIIVDSPYAHNGKSTAVYNESGAWGLKDLVQLLSKLDKAHEDGIKWVVFNEAITKGSDNKIIQKWINKYNVKILKDTTSGCSYQRTDARSVEVMVTNF